MNLIKRISLVLIFFSLLSIQNGFSQEKNEVVSTPVAKKWFESFSIRGYQQVRYNRLFETNDKLKCEQCDRSWGENGGFFIRRMRIIFYGQINKRVYFYVQPDFASSASSTSLHFGQLRDAYFDVGLDDDNEYRFRIGQSKIAYGFENMQSSQNRLPLDRNDALNSAVANERDLGVFFYYAPKNIRKLFSELVSSGLKGSGDYGVFGFGLYNGQTANKPELNNEPHVFTRLAYPFKVGNQIIEPAIQAYSGKFVIANDQLSAGVKTNADKNYLDQRAAASFILYPKPFGIMAEYNVGRGPEFNKVTDSIEVRDLHGGYVTFSYFQRLGKQVLIPFTRLQYYQGGKKHERDARSYDVKEMEIGAEWQPNKNLELVVMYTFSNRRFEDFALQNNRQIGQLMRIQAQFNF
ncbi:MAG: OprO/OprP family phosphate-selective porin [Bacteroidia bacterium]|nr:OprO/OprP family phosphate-selective porin [Bacteroidia bacterium]